MSTFFATWSIENFSMCSIGVGEALSSPTFRIPEVGTSDWNIRLYPRGIFPARQGGDHLSIFIEREDREKEAEITKFLLSFIIVNTNCSASIRTSENFEIKYDSYLGYRRIITHEDLYKDAKRFLPNDTLTVRVGISPRIDLNENDIDKSTQVDDLGLYGPPFTKYASEECFSVESGTEETAGMSLTRVSFLTRIPVERRVLKWKIKEFSVMRRWKEKTAVTLESQLHPGIKLFLQCYVDGSRDIGEILMMDIIRKGVDFRRIFVKCKITFLDQVGGDRCLKTSEHVFSDTYTRWTFPVLCEITQNLLADDTITMNCEFNIAYDPQNVEKFITGESSSSSSTGHSDLIDKILSLQPVDVRLVCKDDKEQEKEFEVHRVLLCAMSPVFQAMFSGDNLETKTGVVRMNDVGASTVQYFKDYLYSESVQSDLHVYEAMKLYSTADKYQMEDLKNKCAALLKSDICIDNVCEMLEVADMYQDSGLKGFIVDFLVKEMDFDSDQWLAFKKVNAPLAAETMRKCLVEMKKSSRK